jgi:nicotinate phosphoribosyltransferase
MDGAITASRAAYLGGCAATSNVLAGMMHGIPVKGTHAHSWIMIHDDELEAFEEYAEAMPNNCVLLVDTYDTIEGVRSAIEVGRGLRKRGYELAGVRLDSGDLAWLSREARRMLDRAGFPDASIVASNDLDERIIASLKQQGSAISVWGVGTKLVTAYDQPALGGVYKLSAIRRVGEDWKYCVKLSEQTIKVSNPGVLQVRRYSTDAGYACDVIYDEERHLEERPLIVDPKNHTRRRRPPPGGTSEDLLRPVLRAGKPVETVDDLQRARERCAEQLGRFYEGCLRLDNPHEYPVGLEIGLHEIKTRLILEARRSAE